MPSIDSLDDSYSTLFIFNDLVAEERKLLDKVSQLFIRGRKKISQHSSLHKGSFFTVISI